MASSSASSDSLPSRGRSDTPVEPQQRRRRRQSPTPFFVPVVGGAGPKPPKPLIKLDKSKKTGPPPTRPDPIPPRSPDHFLSIPQRPAPAPRSFSPSPDNYAQSSVIDIHARHSFLAAWTAHQPSPSPPRNTRPGGLQYHLPRPPPSAQIPVSPISPPESPDSIVAPHTHPLDDDAFSIDSVVDISPLGPSRVGAGDNKAAQVLGNAQGGYPFVHSHSRPASLFFDDFESHSGDHGWYMDNEHAGANMGPATRESMLISPIEFPSRPASLAVHPPPRRSAADADGESVRLGSISVPDPEEEDEDTDADEPPTIPNVEPLSLSSPRLTASPTQLSEPLSPSRPLPKPRLAPVVIPTYAPPPQRLLPHRRPPPVSASTTSASASTTSASTSTTSAFPLTTPPSASTTPPSASTTPASASALATQAGTQKQVPLHINTHLHGTRAHFRSPLALGGPRPPVHRSWAPSPRGTEPSMRVV